MLGSVGQTQLRSATGEASQSARGHQKTGPEGSSSNPPEPADPSAGGSVLGYHLYPSLPYRKAPLKPKGVNWPYRLPTPSAAPGFSCGLVFRTFWAPSVSVQ